MQKISVDLIRLAVSSAVICAGVAAAELRGLHHGGQFVNAKDSRRAANSSEGDFRGRSGVVLDDRRADWRIRDAGRASRARSDCAILLLSFAPTLRRLSQPQSRLALAP